MVFKAAQGVETRAEQTTPELFEGYGEVVAKSQRAQGMTLFFFSLFLEIRLLGNSEIVTSKGSQVKQFFLNFIIKTVTWNPTWISQV